MGYSPWCCKELDTTEQLSHTQTYVISVVGGKRKNLGEQTSASIRITQKLLLSTPRISDSVFQRSAESAFWKDPSYTAAAGLVFMSKNSRTFLSNANSKKSLGQPGKELSGVLPIRWYPAEPKGSGPCLLVFFSLDSDALGREWGLGKFNSLQLRQALRNYALEAVCRPSSLLLGSKPSWWETWLYIFTSTKKFEIMFLCCGQF